MLTTVKKLLFIQAHAPYGQIAGRENLDLLLAAPTFEQLTSILFIEDGVWHLLADQNAAVIGLEVFTKAYAALPLYDVNPIYVEQVSLQQRGLTTDDLILPVTLVNMEELKQLIAQDFDHCLCL